MNEAFTDNFILPDRVFIEPEILYQEIGDEVVVLNLRNEHYYGLDEVGARAWQLLTRPEQGGNVASVVAQLLNEFEVEKDVLQQDLANLFYQLKEAGLITLSETA